MTFQLKVVHRTGYEYDDGVASSYNEARMTPQTTTDQLLMHARLDISPAPWTTSYRDYWGTEVTAFEVHELHRTLTVTATSTVQVNRPRATPGGLAWESLAEPAVWDGHAELLEVSPRVAPPAGLAELAAEIRAGAERPSDFAEQVCDLVNSTVEYVTGSSEVHTTAEETWESRAGVCQDMAHLCLGVLRSAGIPARYVSGYLHPSVEPVIGEKVVGESHAWIEWWDGDWFGFDPTNDTVPDDRYVIVAHGRDYTDVAPLRGIFSGGNTSSMFVEVELTRLA